MSEKEETEQETYHEIVRLIKEKDKKIETLETEMNSMKEMMKQNAQEKERSKIVGNCVYCHTPIRAADLERAVCPYCGHSANAYALNP